MHADKIADGMAAATTQADQGVGDAGGAGSAMRRFVLDPEERQRGMGKRAGKGLGVALRVGGVAKRVRREIARVGGDQALERFGDEPRALGRPRERRERRLARRRLAREDA